MLVICEHNLKPTESDQNLVDADDCHGNTMETMRRPIDVIRCLNDGPIAAFGLHG